MTRKPKEADTRAYASQEQGTLQLLNLVGITTPTGIIDMPAMRCFTRLSAGQFLMYFLSSHKIRISRS